MPRPGDEVDPLLEVDPAGAVHVGKAAQRRLSGATGRWRLVPSVADLLIWQRVRGETSVAEAVPSGVMLSGVIDAPGALGNFLNYVHFASLEGALTVHSGSIRKTLYFRLGQLLAATSNLPEDRLGALLVRFGLLSEADLAACVCEVSPHRRLGTILVDKNLVTSHDLYEGVKRQAEEIFYSTLLFCRGFFYLTRTGEESTIPVRLHLDTQGLLLEGMRRIDEMGYFRAKLPSADVVLVRRVPPPVGEAELEGPVRAVYDQVNGTATLREIAVLSRLGEFAATKATFELLQTNFLEVRQPNELRRQRPVPTADLPKDASSTIVSAYNGALARLFAAMRAKGKESALRQGVTAFVSGSARYADLFRGVEPSSDGTLSPELLGHNLETRPVGERAEHLQRGLNELLFFVLFVAGDAIDRAEEQELHERVARALERLPKGG